MSTYNVGIKISSSFSFNSNATSSGADIIMHTVSVNAYSRVNAYTRAQHTSNISASISTEITSSIALRVDSGALSTVSIAYASDVLVTGGCRIKTNSSAGVTNRTSNAAGIIFENTI